jgi:spermidine/putrescine-binding protein
MWANPLLVKMQTDYQLAADMLQKVRKDIKVFTYNGHITDLANGNICVALGYGSDFNIAAFQAKEAKKWYQNSCAFTAKRHAIWF